MVSKPGIAMSGSILWIAGPLIVIALVAARIILNKRRKRNGEEADPEDNYPLW